MKTRLLVLLLFVATVSLAQSAPPRFVADAVGPLVVVRAPDYDWDASAVEVIVDAPTRDELDSRRAKRAGGDAPELVGVMREVSLSVRREAAATAGWKVVARVTARGADRVRLRLEGTSSAPLLFLPWGGSNAVRVDRVTPEGRWTPSVRGPDVLLLAPAGAALDFAVTSVGAIIGAQDVPQIDESCLVDAPCVTPSQFDSIDLARRAVAFIEYPFEDTFAVCSAALINRADQGSVVPYLLTAEHCVSDQTSASGLDAFFDFAADGCGGAAPVMDGLPRSHGATLVAHLTDSDFALLRLDSIPAGRVLLGWNADESARSDGHALYYVTHPMGRPQKFAVMAPFTPAPLSICKPWLRATHIYQNAVSGGLLFGSSGGAALLPGGYIVGQVHGTCGDNASQGCDYTNRFIAGALSFSYATLAPFLGNCTPPSITAQPAGATIDRGASAQLSVTGSGTAPLSYQWFEGSDPVAIPGATSATLTVRPARTTDYRVRVGDLCATVLSSVATVTVNGPALPDPPTSIGAVRHGESATVTWQHSGEFENGFRVEASKGGGGFASVATVVGDVRSVAVPTLDVASSYALRVVALTAGGESDPSAVAWVGPATRSRAVSGR